MKIIIVCLVLSFSAFSKENLSTDQVAFKKAAISLYKIYDIGMRKVVKKYNTKRKNPAALIDKKYKEYGFSKPKKKSILPKATFEDGIFQIKPIQFKYSFQNFLDGSFELVGKTYKLQCVVESECFYQFLEEYNPKQTSAISWIISEAYASNPLQELLDKEHLVMGALLLTSQYMMEQESGIGGLFCTDQCHLLAKDHNLNQLFLSVKQEKENCESQMQGYRQGYYQPGSHNSQFKILEELAKFEGDEDFQDKVEEYLGEDTASFTEGSGISNEQSWTEFLTCEKVLLAVSVTDSRGDTVPRFCLETSEFARTRCTVRANEMVQAAERQAKYCENFEGLKSCLAEYYSSVGEVEQSGRQIEDKDQRDYDHLKDSIQNSEALQD